MNFSNFFFGSWTWNIFSNSFSDLNTSDKNKWNKFRLILTEISISFTTINEDFECFRIFFPKIYQTVLKKKISPFFVTFFIFPTGIRKFYSFSFDFLLILSHFFQASHFKVFFYSCPIYSNKSKFQLVLIFSKKYFMKENFLMIFNTTSHIYFKVFF